MNTEHTPGPWLVNHRPPSSAGFAFWEITDDIDKPIAFVSEPQPRSRDEMGTNARLIAAAPDLLEALAGCRDALKEAGKAFALHNPQAARPNLYEIRAAAAQAAIDKATGNKP